jgi:hypothetical protein
VVYPQNGTSPSNEKEVNMRIRSVIEILKAPCSIKSESKDYKLNDSTVQNVLKYFTFFQDRPRMIKSNSVNAETKMGIAQGYSADNCKGAEGIWGNQIWLQ